ncbi:MAG: nitronate monooxygenase, partial [Planctomycetales bacterium]|nr:nitronate monooxygenase [Planctomycetales bacterium]
MQESPLGDELRERIAQMDGSETAAIAGPGVEFYRAYHHPWTSAPARLQEIGRDAVGDVAPETWSETLERLLAAPRASERLWGIGQDAAFAADWAEQTTTAARALNRFREQSQEILESCAGSQIWSKRSPLARSHGTEYPVVQGPMTRVSDVAEFAGKVAEGGGLPFLALAKMSGPKSRELLTSTRELLGDKSWGVGVLGFAERELRNAQFSAIEEIRPPYAVIAGGRPDQAASFEKQGIRTYLHVPSPGMLQMFVAEGARRFIFEGRECGGHVGPRSSFVLWESMSRVLRNAKLSPDEAASVHVLFAGGIHDSVSASMVAAVAQPLVDLGMKVGLLMGTAYLFTKEIVETNAIVSGFQQEAIRTEETVIVESGPGHGTRCARTDFSQKFALEKRKLLQEQAPVELIRERLEEFNLGRLRVASKGIVRRAEQGMPSRLTPVGEGEQRTDGMYMIGQVAALRANTCSIRELHEEVCEGATQRWNRQAASCRVVEKQPAPEPLDVAIVGMSCLLPGALDIRRLWQNILEGRSEVGEIPADRFDPARWFDSDRSSRDKIYSKWGGFIGDVPFDPLKYGIPPRALKHIEPVQLLALEMASRLLEDAGYLEHNPYRERTSVILGAGGGLGELGSSYVFRSMIPGLIQQPDERLLEKLPEWTEDSFPGLLLNVIAGRISNRFDLGGVNYVVDAACASSLAAIYAACRELADRTSDMVIAGGVDTV